MNSPPRNEFENFQIQNENHNFYNYQINLENNIELQKAIARLEDLLSKKHVENENLISMHNEFKELHEKMRKECSDLNSKLIGVYSEKNSIEKKYQGEIEKLKNFFEKQKEIYETQIFKLSQQDTETLKHKISAEVELKYKHLINQKDIQIHNNQEQIFEFKRKYELKSTELEAFKNEAAKELEILKDNHKNEVKEFLFKIQLLNEKCESNVNRESYINTRSELETYRKNFNELQNEIIRTRKEKEYLILEKNETKINLLKELEEEKLKSKVIQTESEKNSMSLKNFENENLALKSNLAEKSEETKSLMNEKFQIFKNLREKETEIESAKSEIRLLRQKIETREREFENLTNLTHEKEKQRFFNEKAEKEEYQKKIEDLQKNLRQAQIEFKNFYQNSNDELHSVKRDFYMLSEEKRNLIKKITELQEEIQTIQEENSKKNKTIEYYEREYKNLEEEYRNLFNKESETSKIKISLENELNKKSEEIANLNSMVQMKESEMREVFEKLKVEYKTKLKILYNKKNYYKSQCSAYNKKLANILKNIQSGEGVFNKNNILENEINEIDMDIDKYRMKGEFSDG